MPLHRLIAGVIMVAIALPAKLVIARLFELSNDPAGYQDLWLKNIGVSKLFGKMDWWYSNPEKKVKGWRRLLARFGGDPDLLLLELVRRPLAVLWAVVTGRRSARSAAEGDWEEGDSAAKAKALLAANRRELRAARRRQQHNGRKSVAGAEEGGLPATAKSGAVRLPSGVSGVHRLSTVHHLSSRPSSRHHAASAMGASPPVHSHKSGRHRSPGAAATAFTGDGGDEASPPQQSRQPRRSLAGSMSHAADSAGEAPARKAPTTGGGVPLRGSDSGALARSAARVVASESGSESERQGHDERRLMIGRSSDQHHHRQQRVGAAGDSSSDVAPGSNGAAAAAHLLPRQPPGSSPGGSGAVRRPHSRASASGSESEDNREGRRAERGGVGNQKPRSSGLRIGSPPRPPPAPENASHKQSSAGGAAGGGSGLLSARVLVSATRRSSGDGHAVVSSAGGGDGAAAAAPQCSPPSSHLHSHHHHGANQQHHKHSTVAGSSPPHQPRALSSARKPPLPPNGAAVTPAHPVVANTNNSHAAVSESTPTSAGDGVASDPKASARGSSSGCEAPRQQQLSKRRSLEWAPDLPVSTTGGWSRLLPPEDAPPSSADGAAGGMGAPTAGGLSAHDAGPGPGPSGREGIVEDGGAMKAPGAHSSSSHHRHSTSSRSTSGAAAHSHHHERRNADHHSTASAAHHHHHHKSGRSRAGLSASSGNGGGASSGASFDVAHGHHDNHPRPSARLSALSATATGAGNGGGGGMLPSHRPSGRASSRHVLASSRHRISTAAHAMPSSVSAAGGGGAFPPHSDHYHHRRSRKPPLVSCPESLRLHDPAIDAVFEATSEDAAALRRKRWAALGLLHVAWAILAWFIFV